MPALRVSPTVPAADFWDLGRIHHARLSASEHDAFLPRFLPLVLNCHFLGMLSLVCPLAFLLEGRSLYLGGAGQHALLTQCRLCSQATRSPGTRRRSLCLFPLRSNCFSTQCSGSQVVPRGPGQGRGLGRADSGTPGCSIWKSTQKGTEGRACDNS